MVYVDAFENFFEYNKIVVGDFRRGWRIDLVADDEDEDIKQSSNKRAFDGLKDKKQVERVTWLDFLTRAKKVHEQFLDVHDLGLEKRQGKSS